MCAPLICDLAWRQTSLSAEVVATKDPILLIRKDELGIWRRHEKTTGIERNLGNFARSVNGLRPRKMLSRFPHEITSSTHIITHTLGQILAVRHRLRKLSIGEETEGVIALQLSTIAAGIFTIQALVLTP